MFISLNIHDLYINGRSILKANEMSTKYKRATDHFQCMQTVDKDRQPKDRFWRRGVV